jgi:transposase-like protein
MVMPKVYAAEFRRRAVALARSGRPVGQVAVDLKVSEATLFRWVTQDQVDRGERPGLPTVERVEIAQARKRIRELETELEITKQASALFAEGEVRPKGSTR